jgi:di/tricarboxylate transporter
MNEILFFVLAFVIAIFVGTKWKINVGIIAIALTYIASLLLDLDNLNLFTLWPSQLFVMIFAVSVFYSFASINGAMEKLALQIIYRFRNAPKLLPLAIYAITAVIAGSGGGPYVSTIVMTPITVNIAAMSNMNPLLGVIAIVTASGGASLFPISLVGTLIRGLIEQTIFSDMAGVLGQRVFVYGFAFHTLLFLLFYFVLKGYRLAPLAMQKPEPFNKKQKMSLLVIALTVILYVLPSVLGLLLPNSPLLALLKARFNFTFFAVLAAVVCFFLGLGDEKEVFAWIPWKTLVLISGVGMLVGLAQATGMMTRLAGLISANVPAPFIGSALAAVGGIMSYVADGVGVVFPTLFPLVPDLSTQAGVTPSLLYAAVSIGVSTTTMSPFSTGGAMFLSFVQDETVRNKLFLQLIIVPFVFLLALPVWIYISYLLT